MSDSAPASSNSMSRCKGDRMQGVWALCRDSFRPLLQVVLPQRWRFSIQWLHDPAGLLTAEDEGGLRWTSLDPFFRRDRMPVSSLFE